MLATTSTAVKCGYNNNGGDGDYRDTTSRFQTSAVNPMTATTVVSVALPVGDLPSSDSLSRYVDLVDIAVFTVLISLVLISLTTGLVIAGLAIYRLVIAKFVIKNFFFCVNFFFLLF